MFTDYHSHILPCIDDGAKSLDVALQLIEIERQQGVEKIALTPHYYSYEEDIRTFLHRRNESYNKLIQNMPEDSDVQFCLGAEVYLFKNISSKNDLGELCYQNTNYLLIEMPYKPIEPWMLNEIDKIVYDHRIIPVFAHIDRYFPFYGKNDIKSLLNIKDAVFQVNNSCFNKRRNIRILSKVLDGCYPVVLGSDCHNLNSRMPNFKIYLENNTLLNNLKLINLF